MTVEWILYSRLQEGFHWITYYAPFLIAFPVIIWTVMALSAIVHVNKHRNLDISPLADSITESDMLEIDLEDSITESDMLEIDLEQDPTVQDHPLALMKVELIVDDSDDDHLSDLIKELPSWIHSIGDNKMLKRTSSWPPLVTTSSCGKSNRTVSF
ncbi:hypothetical protein PanWU01x14_324130 [Parasponia andersonii]|uniref:Transmembrane protein n=1 Tax=Parasponia andersonii TaxID=3476 RepID=A0A2P5AK94_PARAD|nr:hypothetical protein PanWU01x14_324130 [Parasponia andersonii]